MKTSFALDKTFKSSATFLGLVLIGLPLAATFGRRHLSAPEQVSASEQAASVWETQIDVPALMHQDLLHLRKTLSSYAGRRPNEYYPDRMLPKPPEKHWWWYLHGARLTVNFHPRSEKINYFLLQSGPERGATRQRFLYQGNLREKDHRYRLEWIPVEGTSYYSGVKVFPRTATSPES
jgi:hypothetical protein